MKKLNLNVCGINVDTMVNEVDGEFLVAINPLCRAIGLFPKSQYRRLKRNPQFCCSTHMGPSTDGRKKQQLMIPLREVGMWLCNINANRVKPEVKDRLLQFQKHLQFVIHKAIVGDLVNDDVIRLREEVKMLQGTVNTLGQTVDSLSKMFQTYFEYELDSKAKEGSRAMNKRKHLSLVKESK